MSHSVSDSPTPSKSTTPKKRKYNYTKKTGRPSKKDSIDMKQMKTLFLEGWTNLQICKFFGIDETTLYEWKKKKEFSQLLNTWKAESDTKVEKSLYKRAMGYTIEEEKIFQNGGEIVKTTTLKHYPPDPTSMIFWLKNRQRDKWRDKHEFEHSGEIKGTKVQIVHNESGHQLYRETDRRALASNR